MKKLIILLLCINLSLEFCINTQSSSDDDNRRISQKKCDEYKRIVADVKYINVGFGCKPKAVYRSKCILGTGLIVGGEIAKPGEFPQQAAIGWKASDGKYEFRCGGTLISERFVLTVAHCIASFAGMPFIIRLGDQNLEKEEVDDGAKPKEYLIEQIKKYPKYNQFTKENDIALIKLAKDVTFDEKHIRPACLQQDEEFNRTVVATGWGKTETFGPTSDELMKVVLNVTSNEDCYEKVGENLNADEIFRTQICAGGLKNKDTCEGDSGSPIQVTSKDYPCVYNVVGMTSYGSSAKCGSSLPSIYTKVSPYLDWIESVVWPGL